MQKVHYNYNVLLGGVILAIALAIGALSVSLNTVGNLKAVVVKEGSTEPLRSSAMKEGMSLANRILQLRQKGVKLPMKTLYYNGNRAATAQTQYSRSAGTNLSAKATLRDVNKGLTQLQNQVRELIRMTEQRGTASAKRRATR